MSEQDEQKIRSLHQQLLERWNARDGEGLAALFAEDGNLVGFDGSTVDGRLQIKAHYLEIFADHRTAAYVGKVRGVRRLSADVALLRAVVGMVPPGQSDINPAVNAIQTLVAVKQRGRWRVALFQNTPAAFHGRPELSERLTEELREARSR
ncbi:MAG TPA: SgcJ/EcaC family oxidoreductase [Actinomycetes bacterium]|nr:SgcJ/EcaC family oxidoreductase [Actinomycetes bacterium]